MKRQLITLLSYSSVLTDKIFAEGQKNYFNKYLSVHVHKYVLCSFYCFSLFSKNKLTKVKSLNPS